MRYHKCPTCGKEDECNIVPYAISEPVKHNCRFCGTVWLEDGVVISGSGEPESK